MNEKVVYQKFDSLAEMSEWIKKTPQTKEGEKYNVSDCDSEYKAKTFFGTENFDEAEYLLLHGDADNAAKLEKYMKHITAGKDSKIKGFRAKGLRNGFRVSPVGFCPVVPKVLAGDPCNMIGLHRELKSTSKVLNIALSLSTSYTNTAEELNLCYVRILSAIFALEESGYRVNLSAIEAARMTGGIFHISIKLKDSGKKMDILRLAYPLLHPSFQRRHCLAVDERMKGKGVRLRGNYGEVISADCEEGIEIIRGEKKYLAIVDYETCKNKNIGEIIDFIKAQL